MSGVSVYFAVKTAVPASREDRGFRGTFKLATPSTPIMWFKLSIVLD